IFMVADPDVRAARRRDELARRGHDAPLQTVREDLLRRDRQDAGRAIAPLRRADDAVELDTSRRSFEEQVQFVIDKIRERQEKAPV
ncbi:MAG: (d)CMP kinase, partial [Rhodothermales bacterium]|nr:(d)CMP kinase [Rhodothermales bacterium]